MSGRDMAMVQRQLVHAFIYSIAIFGMGTAKLTDVLSSTELCLDDDTRANPVAAGQSSWEQVVFAVYTDLHSSARGISPRNLNIVSDSAVYAELIRIAPRLHAPPGTSLIDLEVLRPTSVPNVACQQAPESTSSTQTD